MQNHLSFDAIKGQIDTARRILPPLLANQAQNYFLSAFDKQAWNGVAWPEVQRRIKGTMAWKYPKNKDLTRRTRMILIGKGSTRLRRAVNNSVRVQAFPLVRLVVDLPYAEAHNDGNDNLPQRRFMGQTEELTKMQVELVQKTLGNIKSGV